MLWRIKKLIFGYAVRSDSLCEDSRGEPYSIVYEDSEGRIFFVWQWDFSKSGLVARTALLRKQPFAAVLKSLPSIKAAFSVKLAAGSTASVDELRDAFEKVIREGTDKSMEDASGNFEVATVKEGDALPRAGSSARNEQMLRAAMKFVQKPKWIQRFMFPSLQRLFLGHAVSRHPYGEAALLYKERGSVWVFRLNRQGTREEALPELLWTAHAAMDITEQNRSRIERAFARVKGSLRWRTLFASVREIE